MFTSNAASITAKEFATNSPDANGQGGEAFSLSVESNSYEPNSTPKGNQGNVNPPVPEGNSEYVLDAKKLTATALRKKYKLTYTSWRRAKYDCKKTGMEFDQHFFDFRDFLARVGPRQQKKYTLDRIDYTKGYVLDNVRWADKKVQGLNKANVIYLTYKGETQPLVVWAQRTKQQADTLYKRKGAGWSDVEIIEGKKFSDPTAGKWDDTPWMPGHEALWECYYIKYGARYSRLDFYLKYTKVLIEQLKEESCGFYPDEYGSPEFIKHHAEMEERTKLYFSFRDDAIQKARAKVRLENGRESFIERSTAEFSKKREAELYDLAMKCGLDWE